MGKSEELPTLETDVCIVGAGPAGAAASLMLSKLGVRHVVVDQAVFPRDKTCGDGLILYVFKVLKLIDPDLLQAFLQHPKFISTHSGRFYVSKIGSLDIHVEEAREYPPIFYGKRYDFDHFLVERLPSPFATLRLGNAVKNISYQSEGAVLLQLSDGQRIAAQLVLGADGINSVVSRKLGGNRLDKQRSSAFVSAYFKGLEGLSAQYEAEIRLIYRGMPLFFYIFPLPNGEANISLGGLSADISRLGINLVTEVEEIIQSHPEVAQKFRTAQRVGAWRGWGIPCHFGKLRVSGERFLLLGDAAGLANAFYKEGVGTAMMSGMIAAQKAQECLQTGNFSPDALADYEQRLNAEFGRLLKFSRLALRIARYRKPFAWFVTLLKRPIEHKIHQIINSRTYGK